jgi:CRISPR-associated endoribonuclease Cas6
MRFKLTLITYNRFPELTLNYQYPLSAVIYKILQRADEAYALFLHEQGYKRGGKTFKFFTFSDLRTPFSITGDRLRMKTNQAELTVCFHIPETAENFIKGLFLNQQLEIADRKSKVIFNVTQVMAENALPNMPDNKEILLQPMSPLVIGDRNERGHYDYLSPENEKYAEVLINNLLEKHAAAYGTSIAGLSALKKEVTVIPVFFSRSPRCRLITIKEGTLAQTKVKGYDKFRLRLKAPEELVDLALNAGLGVYNAMGMGSMELLR